MCALQVLGNIKVGNGSQIAAGSLVVKPVLEGTMVAGSPAREVRWHWDWVCTAQEWKGLWGLRQVGRVERGGRGKRCTGHGRVERGGAWEGRLPCTWGVAWSPELSVAIGMGREGRCLCAGRDWWCGEGGKLFVHWAWLGVWGGREGVCALGMAGR